MYDHVWQYIPDVTRAFFGILEVARTRAEDASDEADEVLERFDDGRASISSTNLIRGIKASHDPIFQAEKVYLEAHFTWLITFLTFRLSN